MPKHENDRRDAKGPGGAADTAEQHRLDEARRALLLWYDEIHHDIGLLQRQANRNLRPYSRVAPLFHMERITEDIPDLARELLDAGHMKNFHFGIIEDGNSRQFDVSTDSGSISIRTRHAWLKEPVLELTVHGPLEQDGSRIGNDTVSKIMALNGMDRVRFVHGLVTAFRTSMTQ